VAAFLAYLRRSRRRALDLVDLRTGELRYQALHDALTGLPNRALLVDRAEHMLARSRRRPMTIGVLYVDLDNFKQVNDTFGHQIGDQLLVQVGQRLRTVVREGDTVGRLGGDEFLVLTEGDVDADLEMVAERLVTALRDPFDLPGSQPLQLTATASIGVAMGPRDNTMDLIRDADVALYQAKAAGRNRFCVFQKAMQTTVHDRLTLEMDLRGALAGGQLFLAYQPIVRLHDCATTGVEALVRWRHPVRGVVPPLEFVPIAERSGLIVDIGRFVLSSACWQAAAWHADGLDLQMAVNVSALQLEEPGFVDDLYEILRSSGLEPSKLTLELTESVLVADTVNTADILRALKDIGVRIAIDDFGTGYSSLSYLRHFPIDLLKIDRTFVARQDREDHWAAFLHMLIELGRTLGIQTLAEGVEDSEQLAHLQMEHCDLGQGYLFARPMPPDTVPSLFTQRSRAGTERSRAGCAA
jgi:diguanylate cyclase (GGDEF)-like protein